MQRKLRSMKPSPVCPWRGSRPWGHGIQPSMGQDLLHPITREYTGGIHSINHLYHCHLGISRVPHGGGLTQFAIYFQPLGMGHARSKALGADFEKLNASRRGRFWVCKTAQGKVFVSLCFCCSHIASETNCHMSIN